MLDELRVRNLGIIEEATVYPGQGLTVLTGETGAGKTLLLGALRLLLGAEGRADLVGPFADEAVVEGRFIFGGSEITASRRLQREGRSRAYLDGSIASTKALAEALADRVDIIGQHDHLSLTRTVAVRSLLDSNLDAGGRALLDRYRQMRREWEGVLADQERLGGDRRALTRELDLVSFQSEEIARAGFVAGDDQELEHMANRLRHAETLSLHLATARGGVEAGQEALGGAVAELRRAMRLDPDLAQVAEQAGVEAESLSELGRGIRLAAEGLSSDPEELALVEARLTLLGELRRKYGSNLEEVLAFGKAAAARAADLTTLLDRADSIDSDLNRLQKELSEIARHLTEARRNGAGRLADDSIQHLRELGMGDPVLLIEVVDAEPGPWGADEVRLLFASDSRLSPAEVARVASGGELSRLVLSLRLAAGQREGLALVLVFDEIDAGIGGATALAMGRKLATLARDRQVLCVTHLPQVAAFAKTHLVIERNGATATVRPVETEDRTAELARMLAGLPDSERGREAAAELLEIAGR